MEENRYANLVSKQEEFLKEFQPFLEQYLKDKEIEFQTYLPEAKVLLTALFDTVLSGGKRLRPFLVWLGSVLAGEKKADEVLLTGLVFELLHTFVIIHNDIIDEATLRRGKATVNQVFALATTKRLDTDKTKVGANQAMLVGDLGFVLTAEQIIKIKNQKAQALLLQTAEEVIVGQHLEYDIEGVSAATAEYLDRVRLIKSGLSTLTRPLQAGALLAGASEDDLGQIAVLGATLGHLFQLRDDWLGLYGDTKKTGKPAGDDIRQGKLTSVSLFMLKLAPDEQKNLFLKVWGIKQSSEADILAAVEATKTAGAAEELEHKIGEKILEAIKVLQEKFFASEQQVLVELVQYLGEREA